MKVLDFLSNAVVGVLIFLFAVMAIIGIALVIICLVFAKQYQKSKKQHALNGAIVKKHKKWVAVVSGGIGTAMLVIVAGMAIYAYSLSNTESRHSSMTNYQSQEESSFNQAVDNFFAAVDAHDKNAIKELFAPNALEQTSSIDNDIQQLLNFYSGPTDRCERDGSRVAGGYHDGIADANSWFAVISNGTTYYCYFTLRYRNESNKEDVGIQKVNFVSEKVVCSEDFTWPKELGINVIEDAEGDYLTRRIGGHPTKYTPMERSLTEEDFRTFIKESNSLKELIKQFGEPNAETTTYVAYAYELEEENGEPRYAKLLVEGDTIIEILVVNDVDMGSVRTILKLKK